MSPNPGVTGAVGGGPEYESPWRIKETLGVQPLVALHLRDTHPGELFACSWVACSLWELANHRSPVSSGQQDTDVKASEYLDYLYAVFTCEGPFQFYLFTTLTCSGLRSHFLCPLWFLWICALWALCLPSQGLKNIFSNNVYLLGPFWGWNVIMHLRCQNLHSINVIFCPCICDKYLPQYFPW